MGCGRRIAATLLGGTLIVGPVVYTITEPLHSNKPQHDHVREVVGTQVNTIGQIIILSSGSMIRPELTASGVYVLGPSGEFQRVG